MRRIVLILAVASTLAGCGKNAISEFEHHQTMAAARLRLTAGFGGQAPLSTAPSDIEADREAMAEYRKAARGEIIECDIRPKEFADAWRLICR